MEKQPSFQASPGAGSPSEPQLTSLRKAELLRGVDLFSSMTVEELFQVAEVTREVQFASGEIVARENDVGNPLYLVVQGRIGLISRREEWSEEVKSGESFGLLSWLTREPLSFTAKATEDTMALAIGSEDFFSLLSSDTEIASSLFKYFAKKCGIVR
jgi:CRP/FNR family cyclic AMP-dependent transcriptional regulator